MLPIASLRVLVLLSVAGLLAACGREPASSVLVESRPAASILLITLDTTRADAIGPEARGVETPAFDALAARGVRFRQAYATTPETLPSHASMMTGLYPGGHGVHENGRFLAEHHPVAAERLRQAGYRTAAFVSSYVLVRRFGLARGFDVYDDEQAPRQVERSARETTDRAVAYLAEPSSAPLLLWVHYFDPHAPYVPDEPFRSRYRDNPYLGEIAAMDEQIGRLVDAFDRHVRDSGLGTPAIVVASDHGEGLGDHGEAQHGNLLYQSTMHVPLVVAGHGFDPGLRDEPVSIRRVFHTILDLAGLDDTQSLRHTIDDVVLGEAMKPFLGYGWQPQVMGVAGRHKAIFAGRLEVYDILADPAERIDLHGDVTLPPELLRALEDYPIPSVEAARAPEALDADARRRLASLGYISAGAPPVIRPDAPRPVDMVHLFDVLDRASTLFVQERYTDVIPLLEKILAADRYNLDAALRLATAYSLLGQETRAVAAFDRAASIAPQSPDVRLYRALHDARGRAWERAVPVLEQAVADSPGRLPALEGLALVRERQGRTAEALTLRLRIRELRPPSRVELVQVGELAMAAGQTPVAIEAFEQARAAEPAAFRHDLELGVLYMDARRFNAARDALDRVPPSHPEYPMALFKRAQLSVLLNEPDRAARIEAARRRADDTTRPLIERERLFR
jgi:arylsulfatase A-like enzyme/Tfp pilus assembly protein PilF